MKINPDGLINVEEKISFSFSGSYTFAFRDIPDGYWQVKNIQVFEGITPLKTEIGPYGNYTRIKWFYSASNEIKTFTNKYDLINAVTAYTDVAELNWKVWGEGWGVPLSELNGFIELPAEVSDANEVYVWGHPEVNGKIGVVGNKKIIFQVFGLGSNDFVEIHTAFPVSLLSSKENVLAKNEFGLQKIIEEEKNYQSSGDAYQNFEAFVNLMAFLPFFPLLIIIVFVRHKVLRIIAFFWIALMIILSLGLFSSNPFALILILLQVALFFSIWHFFGREPKTEYNAIYERDVPFDYSPAIVNALLDQWGKAPSLNQITAEILDLCLKGKLKIEEIRKPSFLDKGEYKIHIIDRSYKKDLPHSERIIFNEIQRRFNAE